MWTLLSEEYRQSLGREHAETHWLELPPGYVQVSQKQVVCEPNAVTKVLQKPLELPVLAAQLSATRIPRERAHMKCVRGRATLVPSAPAQTPSSSTLPHVQAPVP